jgi:hypothetical protein
MLFYSTLLGLLVFVLFVHIGFDELSKQTNQDHTACQTLFFYLPKLENLQIAANNITDILSKEAIEYSYLKHSLVHVTEFVESSPRMLHPILFWIQSLLVERFRDTRIYPSHYQILSCQDFIVPTTSFQFDDLSGSYLMPKLIPNAFCFVMYTAILPLSDDVVVSFYHQHNVSIRGPNPLTLTNYFVAFTNSPSYQCKIKGSRFLIVNFRKTPFIDSFENSKRTKKLQCHAIYAENK